MVDRLFFPVTQGAQTIVGNPRVDQILLGAPGPIFTKDHQVIHVSPPVVAVAFNPRFCGGIALPVEGLGGSLNRLE